MIMTTAELICAAILSIGMPNADFACKHMDSVVKYSEKYNIDPRKLIIELCEENKVDAPRDMVERIADKLSKETANVFTARFRMDQYYGNEQKNNP